MNGEKWKNMSDSDKVDFLRTESKIILKDVFDNNEVSYASLFFICKSQYDSKLVSISGQRDKNIEIFFDWKK